MDDVEVRVLEALADYQPVEVDQTALGDAEREG